MSNNEDLIKKAKVEEIAEKGAKIYEKIKIKYEPQYNGKFLAIEVESEKAYLGDTSAEALELAKKEHPSKIFYVVKIGFDVAETMAQTIISTR